MNTYPHPSNDNGYLADYLQNVLTSLHRLANIELVDSRLTIEEQARLVFTGDFYLLAHDSSEDPVFNYGNQQALSLFEMSWDEFTALPSRHSAEAGHRADRERFLQEVATKGYSSAYTGIRISKNGKRFKIKDVLLWNVYDQQGHRIGQAAKFDGFERLDD